MTNFLSGLPTWYVMVFVGIFGLIIGSFLNVVALRSISGESIVLPPSKCPKCGKRLKWYHNIPVLSYIFLGGKCAFCKEKISLQYPIVEALCAILFMLLVHYQGFCLNTLFYCCFVSLIIVISICDLREKMISVEHTIIFAVLGLLFNYLNLNGGYGLANLKSALIGMVCGFVFVMLLIKMFHMLTDKETLGEGDAYILAAIGALVGYKFVLISFFLTVLLQALLMLPVFLFQYYKTKRYLTLFSLLTFGALTLAYLLAKHYILPNGIIKTIYLVSLAVVGLYSCRRLLKEIKQGGLGEITAVPLAPMLLLSGAIVFIFQNNIIDFFNSLF